MVLSPEAQREIFKIAFMAARDEAFEMVTKEHKEDLTEDAHHAASLGAHKAVKAAVTHVAAAYQLQGLSEASKIVHTATAAAVEQAVTSAAAARLAELPVGNAPSPPLSPAGPLQRPALPAMGSGMPPVSSTEMATHLVKALIHYAPAAAANKKAVMAPTTVMLTVPPADAVVVPSQVTDSVL